MPRKSGLKGAILGRSTAQRKKNRVKWRVFNYKIRQREEAVESFTKEES